MYVGKTLFAQLMDFLPWTTFGRIVVRYGGDYRVRTLTCTEHFRIMAFAQLTYRESLRDIEACLSAQAAKLYHMGIRSPVKRSTLADASERRDWRIYAEFAQRLITQARKLYAGETLGVALANTVYALDSTTIDLCLSLFPWAPFRATKAAVKMHTLLDLRGAIPSFIHISDGKLHDVNALDLLIPEPGAIYIMDRAYLDFERLFVLHQASAFFVTRAKSNLDCRRVYSAPTDRGMGIICDQTIALAGLDMSLACEARRYGFGLSMALLGFLNTKIYEGATAVGLPRDAMLNLIPVRLRHARAAAHHVVNGALRGRRRIFFPYYVRVVWWLQRLHPAAMAPFQALVLRRFRATQR